MIAFTFPGQGSQKPQMGAAWTAHPSWELVDEAADATNRDVAHLLMEADAEELTQTRNAQLATFVLSMVMLDAIERLGLTPEVHAGHSLGEYSALCSAGVIGFEDAVRLVAERGEAMQVAAEESTGTMAAILGLDDDQVDVACRRVAGEVWVANFNGPGQVVIAGSPGDVDAAATMAKELGAKRAMPLPVSGAFHTPFMIPARDRLRKAIAEVEMRDANRPVVANVDAVAHTDAADFGGLLNAQLCSPVRWRQSLHTMHDMGITQFVEVGPGTVLTGLAKRTIKGTKTISVSTPADIDALLESVASNRSAGPAHTEGEFLYMTERLVVSPAHGVFEPEPLAVGAAVEPGQIIGHLGDTAVRSAFAGTLKGMIAQPGERLVRSQAVAWLCTASV